MTISSTTQKLQYDCDGVTTTFNYTFKIWDDSDLDVIITSAGEVETQLTLTTDYKLQARAWTLGEPSFLLIRLPMRPADRH